MVYHLGQEENIVYYIGSDIQKETWLIIFYKKEARFVAEVKDET